MMTGCMGAGSRNRTGYSIVKDRVGYSSVWIDEEEEPPPPTPDPPTPVEIAVPFFSTGSSSLHPGVTFSATENVPREDVDFNLEVFMEGVECELVVPTFSAPQTTYTPPVDGGGGETPPPVIVPIPVNYTGQLQVTLQTLPVSTTIKTV